jgi:hypothetical protein
MSKEKKMTATSWLIGIATIAIAIVVTLFIFVFRQPCDGINNEYLSCKWTGGVIDWIGLILFYNGCFWISGLYGLFIKDDDQDPWKTIVKWSFFGGAAGILVIFLT